MNKIELLEFKLKTAELCINMLEAKLQEYIEKDNLSQQNQIEYTDKIEMIKYWLAFQKIIKGD